MSATALDPALAAKALSGERLTPADALALYRAPLEELGSLANARRKQIKAQAYDGRGNEIVTFIVDRNVNYTNVCDVHCKFCAFYRTERNRDSYVISREEMDRKLQELAEIGGVQVLLQGGHHPGLPIDWYLEMLSHMRERFPQIAIHGFSPPEFQHFTRLFKMPLRDVLAKFKEAGLRSIPGGGAEILVDRVREQIAPRKCSTDEWLEVMDVAHGLGLTSSATMMFGHVETVEERIEHLRRLREQQDRSGGFTAFICWTFQPEHTALKGRTVGAFEYLRTLAVARLFLDNFENIQASWVTQGPKIGQVSLEYGANDFGSVMMEENVVSSAGAHFKLQKEEIQAIIREAGYEPRLRDTRYRLLD